MTRPRFTVFDAFRLTLPTRQWAFVIADLATASSLPRTFGTLQGGRPR